MEMVQQNDMGEAGEIFQSGMELLKYLNSAHHAVGPGRLNGHALQLCKGRMDDANWCVLDFHVFIDPWGSGLHSSLRCFNREE